jgi:hypothetical protein
LHEEEQADGSKIKHVGSDGEVMLSATTIGAADPRTGTDGCLQPKRSNMLVNNLDCILQFCALFGPYNNKIQNNGKFLSAECGDEHYLRSRFVPYPILTPTYPALPTPSLV